MKAIPANIANLELLLRTMIRKVHEIFTIQYSSFTFLVTFLCFLIPNQSRAESNSISLGARFSTRTYTGPLAKPWSSTVGLGLNTFIPIDSQFQWSLHLQSARDNAVGRYVDHSFGAGIRFYCCNSGENELWLGQNQIFSFEPLIAPYSGLRAGLGRYLLKTYGTNSLLESSSEYIYVQLPVGVKVPLKAASSLYFEFNARACLGIGSIEFSLKEISAETGFEIQF